MGAETLWGDGLQIPAPTLLIGENNAVLTAPLPTMAVVTIDAILTAPIPVLVSNDGNVMRLTASVPTLSSDEGFESILTAPVPTLSSDEGFESILTVPIPSLVANDFPYARLTASVPTLNADSGPVANLSASVPTLDAVYISHAYITAVGTAPAPRLSATGYAGEIITVEATVCPPVLVATLVNPSVITAILTLRAPSISAQILTGNVATILAAAATPIIAAAGYPAYTITFAGTVPAPRLTATLTAAVAAAYRTWVLNTRKGALTEYNNFDFNSYCVFNGNVLAAGSNGVVVLGTQALDNATAISSTVKSGKDNFGSSVIKRIPRIYLDYTTGGDAQFKLITTEGGSRTYALHWNNVTGTQTRRIPVGKGPKSARWQWEYANVSGADFDIGAVLAFPQALRRRVQ